MSDERAQAAAEILGSELGWDAIYQAAEAGSPVPCRALLKRNLQITDTYGTVIEVQTAISLPRTAVDMPANGDTVEISGTVYRVGRVVRFDDYLVTVSCT